MARRRVSRGTSRTHRKLVWAREPSIVAAIATGVFNGFNILSDFETQYGANLIGCTIMRMRIRWSCFVETPAIADMGFIGVRVAENSTISGVDNTDPVGPFEDPHADWMTWDSSHPTATLPETGTQGPQLSRYLDVKSMRKVDELGEVPYLLMDHTSAATMTFHVSVSALIALP